MLLINLIFLLLYHNQHQHNRILYHHCNKAKMLRLLISFLISCSILASASAFVAPGNAAVARGTSSSTSDLSMGFFDGLLGGSKSADASHILLKGPNANKQCEKLKNDIYKKAIGRGDPSMGVAPEKLISAFSAQAKRSSACPSKSNGGSLGSFGPGEMVPEFDNVAFKEQVGVIHGPVETQFGSHLILITDRS